MRPDCGRSVQTTRRSADSALHSRCPPRCPDRSARLPARGGCGASGRARRDGGCRRAGLRPGGRRRRFQETRPPAPCAARAACVLSHVNPELVSRVRERTSVCECGGCASPSGLAQARFGPACGRRWSDPTEVRASGGCLGAERRRRTWHAAKSRGEMRAIVDPRMSEWGNPSRLGDPAANP